MADGDEVHRRYHFSMVSQAHSDRRPGPVRNGIRGKSEVVVVEGFFDCLKVYQAGLPSVVALMGAVLYRSPERALAERFRQVVLMLDGDATGREASRTIADRLRRHCAVRVVHLPGLVQLDQLSAETIRRILGGPTRIGTPPR